MGGDGLGGSPSRVFGHMLRCDDFALELFAQLLPIGAGVRQLLPHPLHLHLQRLHLIPETRLQRSEPVLGTAVWTMAPRRCGGLLAPVLVDTAVLTVQGSCWRRVARGRLLVLRGGRGRSGRRLSAPMNAAAALA